VKQLPGGILIVPVYVDDLMITGTPPMAVEHFKTELKAAYETQDLGPIETYLGVQVVRDRTQRTLALGLPKYIGALEERFQGLLSKGKVKGDRSPMVVETMKLLRLPREEWQEEQTVPVEKRLYMSLLGSLCYAAITCRPDIAFSVSFLSQWGTDPRQLHLDALTRVLRYLVSTREAKSGVPGAGGNSTALCVHRL